jgi:tRNA1Val (adenine37-N6)-methyltransferase
MLPYARFRGWAQKAQAAGFSPRYLLDVSQSPAHGFFRTVGIFGRGKGDFKREHLVIRDIAGKYTPGAKALLGAYYLYFPGD